MKKQTVRICVEIIAGIVLSLIISFIAIAVAYAHVHAQDLSSFTLKLVGLPIYSITKVSSQFKGTANTNNMMLIGVICSIVLVLLGEFWFGFRNKSKGAKQI